MDVGKENTEGHLAYLTLGQESECMTNALAGNKAKDMQVIMHFHAETVGENSMTLEVKVNV